MLLNFRQVEELESQLQNTQDELKTERALIKLNQDAACDEVARAREEIKVGCCCCAAFAGAALVSLFAYTSGRRELQTARRRCRGS